MSVVRGRRPAFAGLLLAILGLIILFELAIGVATYRRLRGELESDLGRRLVDVSRVLALGLDPPLVSQFREGDERLPAYQIVALRLRALAQAAGVERAYVVDPELRTLVDASPAGHVGKLRYALLANRGEVGQAVAGRATATRIYEDEEGHLRLSALAPLRTAKGVVALVGVDANPDFFVALALLRQQMLLLGVGSLLAAAGAGLLLTRQVSKRLGRLREVVSRVSRGDFAGRVGTVGIDEIGALGHDLDTMVGALVAAREYYESVLRSVDVGLVSTDRKGEVIGANEAVARMLRVHPDLVGRRLSTVLEGEPPLSAFFARALSGEEEGLAAEVALGGGVTAGGRIVAASATRLRQSGEWTGVTLSLTDITGLKVLERQVRNNERLAALGSMAGGLLHEIRNPLASVTMYLDLLRPLANSDEGREILGRAIHEAVRLERFLQDFQIFAGLRPLRRDWVEAPKIFESALEGVEVPPGASLSTAAVGPVAVYADARLLSHALRNLVLNAVQAVGTSGRVRLDLIQDAGGVGMQVVDDGPGIEKSEVDRILDPFYSTKAAGTGLGLMIVQRVVEAHGAALEVQSAPGRGSQFTIRWPADATRR